MEKTHTLQIRRIRLVLCYTSLKLLNRAMNHYYAMQYAKKQTKAMTYLQRHSIPFKSNKHLVIAYAEGYMAWEDFKSKVSSQAMFQ